MPNKRDTGRRILWVAILLALALSMPYIVSAFEASDGTITVSLGIGSVSAAPGESHIISCYAPASTYQGGSLAGYFGLEYNQSTDFTPPEITLVAPDNGTVSTSGSVIFGFNASDASGIDHCSLYINSTLNSTIYTPGSGVENFSAILGAGAHTWNVRCFDNFGNNQYSEGRSLVVILASSFDGQTTNLTQANLSNVPNLTIEKSGIGKIRFSTSTNLTGIYDLDSYIKIGLLSIFLNSSRLSALNKSATLTIYNVPYLNIAILRDGAPCASCNISSFLGGTLVFDAPGFSNYTVTISSKLQIFDDTDSMTKLTGQSVRFYANYTNVSSGAPISSLCNISFNLGGWTIPVLMTYNSTSALHEYNMSFGTSGTFAFNISCHASVSGFDDLSAIDTTVIAMPRSGTNYSSIESRLNVTNKNPSVSQVNMYRLSNLAQASIDLTEGTTTTIICNATVEDWNGWSDIAAVNATIYAAGYTPLSPKDNNSLYSTSACTNTYLNITSFMYSCSLDVWYFANNGSWNCNVTAKDQSNATGTAIDTSPPIFNILAALNVSTTRMDFGNMQPGDITTNALEPAINVTNTGNVNINLSVDGFGAADGDGFAMRCTVGNISLSYLRYNVTQGQSYATSMWNLTDSKLPLGIPRFTINRRIDDADYTKRNSTNSTYWKLQVPMGTIGFCNGTVTFSVVV